MKKDTKQTQESQLQVQEVTTLQPIKDEAERLIAMAIDKNVPVESLERLLAMRDKLRAEKAEEEFDKAMATFQAKCPTIEKRKQGYNYKYADLTDIVEQIKGLLAKNGFSYTFDTDEAENAVIVYCKIKHIAGHKETSKAKISNETTSKMNASQQSGASMTYGKRYALCNALGILTGDEDTDAVTPDVSNLAGGGRAAVAEHVVARTSRQATDTNMDILDRVCQVCEAVLPENVYLYSVNHYRKPLCFTHQKQAKDDLQAEGESHREVS